MTQTTLRPTGGDTDGETEVESSGIWHTVFGISVVRWFLVLGGVMGVYLVVAIPPGGGQDEPNHFLHVWAITEGVIVPPTVTSRTHHVDMNGLEAVVPAGEVVRGYPRAGTVIPSCVVRWTEDQFTAERQSAHLRFSSFFHEPSGCAHQAAEFIPYENVAIESPVAYAPQVLAVAVLRLFGAPVPVLFYGARAAGLLAYLAIVGWALRVARRGRAALLVMALLPMSIEQASVVSADGFSLAMVLLLVALVSRCFEDDTTGRRWFVATAAAALVLALCKEPYFLLVPLVLLVPGERLGLMPRAAAWTKVAVVGVGLAIAGGWNLAVSSINVASEYPPGFVQQHAQLHYMVTHPFGYAAVLARTAFLGGSEYKIVPAFVYEIGFFRPITTGEYAAPLAVVLFGVLLFAAYSFEFGARQVIVSRVRRLGTWLPVVLAAATALAVTTSAYVRSTPLASNTVLGLDGRYFIPVAIVPVLTPVMRRRSALRQSWCRWLLIGLTGLLAYAAVKTYIRFY